MILSEAKNQVVKDFPGRFVIEAEQIRYLVQEMKDSLYPDSPEQKSKIEYIYGFQNGVIRQTDNLEELLGQENNRQQRITFLIIVAELLDKDEKPIRRYLIHFGSGEKLFLENGLEFQNREYFNLSFEGVSYRILDSNRSSAMDMMKKFDERVQDYFRWYSKINLKLNTQGAILSFFIWLAFGLITYLGSHANYDFGGWIIYPEYTSDFIFMVGTSTLILLSFFTILLSSVKFIEWLLPPSYFAIGQGKKAYQNTIQNWQQFFWAVPVAIAISILVWLLGF